MHLMRRRERSSSSTANPEQLDELARALVVEEYSSLRAEILASYGFAQSIVRWTLTAFAALTAAALLAMYNADGSSSAAFFRNAAAIAFGIVLPVMAWLSAWTWLGELYRADRAGAYLRSLEMDIARVPGLAGRLGFQPIRWGSFLHETERRSPGGPKTTMTDLGSAAVLFGIVATSLLFFAMLWKQLWEDNEIEPLSLAWVLPVGVLLLNFICGVVCFVIFRRLAKLGNGDVAVRTAYVANPTTLGATNARALVQDGSRSQASDTR
jgi:hypothetical protein